MGLGPGPNEYGSIKSLNLPLLWRHPQKLNSKTSQFF